MMEAFLYAETTPIESRSSKARSRVDNNPFVVVGLDGRSAEARRFKDILRSILGDLGPDLPETVKLRARNVALASLRLEAMQQQAIAGVEVDGLELVRQTNLVHRQLRELMRHRKHNSAPDLPSRLDKIETAIQARKSVNETWLVYLLSDWAEGCPVAFEEWEEDDIPRLKANALDRLVAAGKISEMDRERVTFIVRTIVHPPKWPDGPTQGE